MIKNSQMPNDNSPIVGTCFGSLGQADYLNDEHGRDKREVKRII